MRFLYIDSQGKEVPIPSVDALALRIELGAITETTQFYDSAADRWAPAGEHEVFRSLQREAEEKSAGFVAPPPPPMPPPPVPEATPPVEPTAPEASESEPAPPGAEKARAPNASGVIEGPAAKEEEPAAKEEPSAARSDPDSHDVFGGLDLALTVDEAALRPTDGPASEPAEAEPQVKKDRPEPAASVPPEEPSGDFDFQRFGGQLVDDDEDGDEEEEEERPGPAAESPAAPAEDGLQLEGFLAASYDLPASGGAVSGERIETDEPFSQMEPEQASEWASREGSTDEPVGPERADEAPTRPLGGSGGADRPPRARPAPPPREKESSGVPVAVAVVALVLLAGGGWFGLSMLRGGGEPEVVVEEEIDPPVTIPDIPAALEPRMREVARLALADWVIQVRDTLPVLRGIPVEPDAAWLGSRYLADAGQFPGIAEYWGMLEGYAAEILDREQEIFVSAYEARLVDTTAVAEPELDADPDAAVLVERAGAGFLAGRPDRRIVYRQLQAVIDAATDLHAFLLENQDRIEYEPHPESDPVLEAVPETPELGDEMWDRVDGITAALDGLGALDKVTTERLLALATEQIEQVGVR